jgi:hypothetical protein
MEVSLPFPVVAKFRQPCLCHVMSQGFFGRRLGKVAPLKFGKSCSTGIKMIFLNFMQRS